MCKKVSKQGKRSGQDFEGLYLNSLVSGFCSCRQVEVQHLEPFSVMLLGQSYKPYKLRGSESEAENLAFLFKIKSKLSFHARRLVPVVNFMHSHQKVFVHTHSSYNFLIFFLPSLASVSELLWILVLYSRPSANELKYLPHYQLILISHWHYTCMTRHLNVASLHHLINSFVVEDLIGYLSFSL